MAREPRSAWPLGSSRAHASPGQVLVSSAVQDLSIGKQFAFVDPGPIALKGFDEPIRLLRGLVT